MHPTAFISTLIISLRLEQFILCSFLCYILHSAFACFDLHSLEVEWISMLLYVFIYWRQLDCKHMYNISLCVIVAKLKGSYFWLYLDLNEKLFGWLNTCLYSRFTLSFAITIMHLLYKDLYCLGIVCVPNSNCGSV